MVAANALKELGEIALNYVIENHFFDSFAMPVVVYWSQHVIRFIPAPMNHRLPLILIMLLLLASGAFAQTFRIQGKIIDAQTREPLPNAKVRVLGAQKAVLSEQDGMFYLESPVQYPRLRITYVGYTTLEYQAKEGDPTSLLIPLSQSEIDLEDVVITGEKIEQVYPDPLIHIHNYEFSGENLVLLIQEPGSNQHKLILYNQEDSILDVAYGVEPISGLFRDCFGKVHLLSKNYACQLLESPNQLRFACDSLEEFERVVRPVLGAIGSTLFYGQALNDFESVFYSVTADRKGSSLVYTTRDREKIRRVEDDRLMASKNVPLYGWMGDAMRESSEANAYEQYMKKIGNAPIIVPLKVVGNEAVIFDHANDKLVRFNMLGDSLDEAPISYHKERFWQKKLVVDELRREVYTVFLKNGKSILKEIDLETGEISGEWTIPMQFVQNIRIRGGYAWFIYKDSVYDDIRRLFRMQLK
ncbi:MAG: carboxypeptidase-like regulatory domain-containing protein [Bacteroidia bacterium]|nr:carboxypeptidase-like regulatory domain-containing protein [Bacteroidia bacterium]